MSTTTALDAGYRALTESAGAVDRSERGKLALAGPDAKTFLQGQITNDVESLAPGTGCYAAFLTPKGKMLGDLRVLDAGAELLLDTERSALQGLFNLVRRFSIGYDVTLHKRTLECGLVSVIGPRADELCEVGNLPEDEHAHVAADLDGHAARAIRTDVGIDLLCDAPATPAIIEALRQRGAPRVDEAAAEILRVERGRPRYGLDLDDTVIPQEAGLNDRAVSFTKGCYVGQETVARLFYRGKPNRHLRGLVAQSPVAGGDPVMAGERVVGTITSSVISPRRGPIALALVRREVAPGDEVSVDGVAATVVELPFS